MKKDTDDSIVLPSPLSRDEHKGYFYFERIVSLILMGKGPGEITGTDADTFLRRLQPCSLHHKHLAVIAFSNKLKVKTFPHAERLQFAEGSDDG